MDCSPMSPDSLSATISDGYNMENPRNSISLISQLQSCWCHGLGKDINQWPNSSSPLLFRFSDNSYLSVCLPRSFCSSHLATMGPVAIFMNDNARVHRAALSNNVKHCCE
ncbi:hypothetical protein TNCV_3295251 [Trichonephila clavipes]|uniref:Uncharacterized protein n=1 Tax=Trichonephila clavipes TaxID=2585209 RepID=A0A8X6SYX6_TRICX|nr:hypothetical protein TNCV_3295251 [Trichonephila clavipes]